MALLFTESFGHYGQVGSSLVGIQNNFDTGWILATTGVSSISLGNGFDVGDMALYMGRTGSSYATVERRITTVANEVIIGFEMRASTRATLFRIPGILNLEWSGPMGINGTNGTAVILLNTSYYFEIKINKVTRAVTLRINGYAYTDTVLSPAVTVPDLLQMQWGFNTFGVAGNAAISNVYIADSNGGRYTDFLGPQRYRSHIMESVVPPNWEVVPTDRTNLQVINNLPPLVNQYTQSDTPGSSDFYRIGADVPTDITSVSVVSVLSKSDIDTQEVALGINQTGTVKEATPFEVTLAPTYYQAVFERDANDVNWTNITAANIGAGVVIQGG